jgi:signal transduction histidine kinase
MGTVLIVDDSPSDRALFRTILTRAGFTVHETARGLDAPGRVKELRPHAIVLDVNLPDTDGHEVCRALKADKETAGFPVLMLTVRDNDVDVLAGLDAGADDYVAKDADPALILARLRRLIQFRQLATVAVLNEHLVQVGKLLAGIVHEIRGPLSVIRGSAELMSMQAQPDDPLLQWVEPILRSAKLLQIRLEHLMATVRSGPSVIQCVEPGPLVRESSDLYLKGIDPRGPRLYIDTHCDDKLPPVLVDPGRLIQVLLSLFGNAHDAITSSGRGGRVVVRGDCASQDDGHWVTIEVSDDGPGIVEIYLDRIFEPFFTTKETGTGYGLYLASEILKDQNARLTARNLQDGGACFTLWLPRDVSRMPQAGHEGAV